MVMSNIVHDSLLWYFYLFMVIVAGLLIIRPATNPKKRIYEAVYYAICRRKDTYTAIDYVIDDDEDTEEIGGAKEDEHGDLR